jgi:hypothetical protein
MGPALRAAQRNATQRGRLQTGATWRRDVNWAETMQLWRPRLTVVSEDLFISSSDRARARTAHARAPARAHAPGAIGSAADKDYVGFIAQVLAHSDKLIWLGARARVFARSARAQAACLRACAHVGARFSPCHCDPVARTPCV